jgi:hypothetical protein
MKDYKVQDSGKRQDFETGAVRDTNEGKGRFDLISPVGMRLLAEDYNYKWQDGSFSTSALLNETLFDVNLYMEGFRDVNYLTRAAGRCMASAHIECMAFNGLMDKKLLLTQCHIAEKDMDEHTKSWHLLASELPSPTTNKRQVTDIINFFTPNTLNCSHNFIAISPLAIERLAKHYENGAAKYGDNNWLKGIPVKRFIESGKRHLNKYIMGNRSEDHLIAGAWNFIAAAHTEEEVMNQSMPINLACETNYICREKMDKQTAVWWEKFEELKKAIDKIKKG